MADSRLLDILAHQNQLRGELEMLCSILIGWLPNRKYVKRQLLLLADELNERQKNVNIAKVTGTVTSVVGSGLMIGGFAASFFTFGTSLALSAVGAGIGGAGGLTAAGAGITKYYLNKKTFKKAQEAIIRDHNLTEELLSCLKRLEEENHLSEDLSMSQKDKLFLGCDVAGSLKNVGKNLVYDMVDCASTAKLATTAADVATDTATTVFKTMTTTARVFHIGGFVAGMALVPLDLYTLVTSSINLHKGNTSDAEDKIRGIVKEMVCLEENIYHIIDEVLCGTLN